MMKIPLLAGTYQKPRGASPRAMHAIAAESRAFATAAISWAISVTLSLVVLLVAFPPPVALAQTIEARAAGLKPGEYVWRDDAVERTGAVEVVISLPSQLAFVYRGGALMGISTVSTGKPGKRTPVGEFTILQKRVFHRSNLYSNAPMPYMQRLTWTGIAMHGGDLPGYPASHGCIRFPNVFAKRLFDLTAMGGVVRVVDTPLPAGTWPAPERRALPEVRVAQAAPAVPKLAADVALANQMQRDDRVFASARPEPARAQPAAGPRIELRRETVAFAAYDAVFANGYGAKGGAR
ncbi:L,D-transpeptidase family protein [Sphingomonas sp.]